MEDYEFVASGVSHKRQKTDVSKYKKGDKVSVLFRESEEDKGIYYNAEIRKVNKIAPPDFIQTYLVKEKGGQWIALESEIKERSENLSLL